MPSATGYSRIPLIQQPQVWTGAGLSNITRIITQYLFLQIIFCYCLHRMCTYQLFSVHQELAFSITIGPGMGCHLEHNAVNNFINTLSNCTNLGSLPFTLSPDATNNCNWSFCFFISCAVDNPTLYEALNMFWLVLLSSLLLLQVSEESLMLHVSSHQHYLVYPSWDLLE